MPGTNGPGVGSNGSCQTLQTRNNVNFGLIEVAFEEG
jgi:hypothetical protein